MFTEDFIQNLKQTTVSVDPEKTKQRVGDLWKSASNDDKLLIEKLAGVKRTTIARVYKTGSISAKIVVPMSQTLNVDPNYLTGEADEKGEGTNEALREFLLKHDYEKSLAEYDKAPKRQQRRNKRTPAPDEPQGGNDEGQSAAADTQPEQLETSSAPEPVVQEVIDLSEEEMILLLRAAILKAKQGGESEEIVSKIKTLLLA